MHNRYCKSGFTLIELLVVVLIIGILAAIALPQYTKAVERARMSEAMQSLGDIARAQSVLYMTHGRFANTLEELNALGDVNVRGASSTIWGDVRILTGAIQIQDGISHGEGKAMSYIRANGKYQGGVLRVYVFRDGFIFKSCNNPAGTHEFCNMAANAGYVCNSVGNSDTCPS